jgi:arylsulfatase A-like enzyme
MAGLPDDTRYVDALRNHGPYALDPNTPRPNVFVISVDMIPPEAHRHDGYRDVMHMPALDRLEADSTVFNNAFCPSPLCGPSRAAFMTGRYTYLTVNDERAHDGHEFHVRHDDILFPEYLQAAGYVTRHVGKCHVGAGKYIDAFTENAHPWDRWAPPLADDDEYHQHLDSLGVGGWRYAREVLGRRPDRKTPGDNYGGWLEQDDGRPFPLEATYPYFLAARAARTLRTVANRTGRGRPIYMQLDFFAPHQPFAIPAGLEDREQALREVVRVPETFAQLVEAGFGRLPGEPKIYQTYRGSLGLYDAESVRDYMVANLLQVEVLDHAIGVFLDAMRDEGLYDDSMVILMADHGEMNGERGLVDKGVYGHPKVVRVPFIVHTPGAKTAEQIDTPITLLDLAPTVLGLAGVNPHARLDGADLTPILGGDQSDRAQDFLFEAGWHIGPNPAVSIQHRFEDGRHYLYTYNLTDDHDELYDLNDPTYANLAGDSGHAELRDQMLARLADVLKSDRRWRCYWHTLRVVHADRVGAEPGDRQMFAPE